MPTTIRDTQKRMGCQYDVSHTGDFDEVLSRFEGTAVVHRTSLEKVFGVFDTQAVDTWTFLSSPTPLRQGLGAAYRVPLRFAQTLSSNEMFKAIWVVCQ